MGNYTFSAKELFVDKFNNLYSLDFDDTIYFCSNIGKSRSLSQLVYDGKTEPDYAVKETYEELHVSTLWKKEEVEEEIAPKNMGGDTTNTYFNDVVKRTLLELKDSIKKAKNDPEANFYKGRYNAQLKDFAEAMRTSEENLSLMIDENKAKEEKTMKKYPVMKKQVPVGKILNFTGSNQKYKVMECDGVSYGEKGYVLDCVCVDSPSKSMIGEKYTFDDRVFRDYNGNNIVIEDDPSIKVETSFSLKDAVSEVQKMTAKFPTEILK